MLTRLPHRIVIQNESRSLFEGGCYTSSWITSSTEWANCQISKDYESYKQEKKQQYNKYIIIARSSISISNESRIIFDDKTLEIEAVSNPTNRNRMIEITCREEIS